MKKILVQSALMTLVTLVLTGLVYPLAVTGIAQVLFPSRANGSLVTDANGRVVGSELIAQGFASPAYFQPRPSQNAYDATNSGGSNLGPTSQKLHDTAAGRIAFFTATNGDAVPVPAEMVSATASGLDPHLSPDAATWQVARVAKARGVAAARVQQVVDEHVEGRDLGFLGEPRVNVLLLNLALDERLGKPPATGEAATK